MCSKVSLKIFNFRRKYMFFQMDSKIISAEQEKPLQALTSLTKKSFHLLWRGSRDGFDGKVFHSLCDGKPNTLTVIKSENGCIFGGYTSEPWSSDEGFRTDSSAFLYSLTNPSNTPFQVPIFPAPTLFTHSTNLLQVRRSLLCSWAR